ncbi:MAG: YHS domain-containing protein [bacterium]|jgi:YHS domain-containing protein
MIRKLVLFIAILGISFTAMAACHTTLKTKSHVKKVALVCPVRGEKIMNPKSAPKYVYKGKTYYFCCSACVQPFKDHPEKYIKRK